MSRFHNMHSRREFVKTALTAGAGALFPAVHAAGQDRRQGRIDVHHHCRTAVQGGAGRGPGSDWSPEKSIEQMDKFGIATSIISATVPVEPFYDGTEKSRTVARGVNDFIVKMMVDHPRCFGPYPMAALRSFAPSTQLRLPSDLQLAVDRTNAERLIPRLARAQ